jgi:hypothetical protein
MKRAEHVNEAEQIGAESFSLLNYGQLPRNASAVRQADALKRDQHWQQLHHDEVSSRIDRLIRAIEDGSNKGVTGAR